MRRKKSLHCRSRAIVHGSRAATGSVASVGEADVLAERHGHGGALGVLGGQRAGEEGLLGSHAKPLEEEARVLEKRLRQGDCVESEAPLR